MLYDVNSMNVKALLVALYARAEAERRQRALQSEIDKVKRRMVKRSFHAMTQLIAMAGSASQSRAPRRVIERNNGKWRGSTIAGYLRSPYDSVYYENFRMCKTTFEKLLSLLKSSSFDTVTLDPSAVLRKPKSRRRSSEHMAYARAHTDPPSTRFKLGVCLYAMAQGGRFKLIADAAGLGKSTVRKWMVAFCAAVNSVVKPIYMPAKPPSASERSAVYGRFASRRGLQNVALACDGTHVPFHPSGGKKVRMMYRNYKGWTSILAVAFVDSYHRFFDMHVGFPGKAGDNTVLARYRLMDEIRADPAMWFGENGVIF